MCHRLVLYGEEWSEHLRSYFELFFWLRHLWNGFISTHARQSSYSTDTFAVEMIHAIHTIHDANWWMQRCCSRTAIWVNLRKYLVYSKNVIITLRYFIIFPFRGIWINRVWFSFNFWFYWHTIIIPFVAWRKGDVTDSFATVLFKILD